MQKAVDHAKVAFMYLCQSVGSPYANELLKRARENDWHSVYNADMPDFSAYHSAMDAAGDLAVYSYLRKYEGDQDVKALHSKAITTFRAVEAGNRRTNIRIRHASLKNDVEGLIFSVQRKIARLLGKFSFDEILHNCEWGNGATATIKLAQASVDNKMLESSLSVTPRCLGYAKAYLTYDIHWMSARLGCEVLGPCSPLRSEFTEIDYGVFDTVVKDSKSRRTIDKQPTMNLFFQKGIGKVIRNRLRRVGVNLDDQSRNKSLAQMAHTLGLSTLDLANASNTVTTELVRLCFEQSGDWFDFLYNTRTQYVKIEGELHKLELFSSMGNGFTFELESLIFWALASAVKDEAGDDSAVISVYGDDIIISRALSTRLIAVLTEVGFEVNDRKSFIVGPFFESCGGQYFKGFDITPPYQKEVVDTIPAAIRASNRILRWGVRVAGGEYIDEVAHDAWGYYQVVLSVLHDLLNRNRFNIHRRLMKGRKPKRFRPIVKLTQPYWVEGDGAAIDPFYCPIADRDGIFRMDEWKSVAIKSHGNHDALLAVSLRRSDARGYLSPLEVDTTKYLEEIPDTSFNGLVTIKGRTSVVIQSRRVYDDGSGSTPTWGCRAPGYIVRPADELIVQ